jgi:hypothetical protein
VRTPARLCLRLPPLTRDSLRRPHHAPQPAVSADVSGLGRFAHLATRLGTRAWRRCCRLAPATPCLGSTDSASASRRRACWFQPQYFRLRRPGVQPTARGGGQTQGRRALTPLTRGSMCRPDEKRSPDRGLGFRKQPGLLLGAHGLPGLQPLRHRPRGALHPRARPTVTGLPAWQAEASVVGSASSLRLLYSSRRSCVFVSWNERDAEVGGLITADRCRGSR